MLEGRLGARDNQWHTHRLGLVRFMPVHVLLFEAGTDNEGIHSLELNGRTVVLLFEERDDAERYAGLLEAQDFPVPSVEAIEREEMELFCGQAGYEARFVPSGFLPSSAEAFSGSPITPTLMRGFWLIQGTTSSWSTRFSASWAKHPTPRSPTTPASSMTDPPDVWSLGQAGARRGSS